MKNILKEKLSRGETVVGALVGLGHPDVTEWLSQIGYDWLFLDAEHGPMGYETLLKMMQAMNGTNCTPIVRPEWNDPITIKRLLDIGAHGIIVPMVSTKEEAELAVKACRYPPQGIRGYSPRRYELIEPDYWKTANEEILVAVIIENGEALENVNEILSVEGIDACSVGHFDLSLSLGLPLPPTIPPKDNPRLSEALDRVLEASKKTGKPVGISGNVNNIRWGIEKGFRFNLVGEVDQLLFDAAKHALDVARGK